MAPSVERQYGTVRCSARRTYPLPCVSVRHPRLVEPPKLRQRLWPATRPCRARRPCTALLGQRVSRWNARNVIARSNSNKMARHRTLRRAVASTSAKMPRRSCILGVVTRQEVQRDRMRGHRLCRRRAALQGVSGATRTCIICQ
jgi:hypothetical protein